MSACAASLIFEPEGFAIPIFSSPSLSVMKTKNHPAKARVPKIPLKPTSMAARALNEMANFNAVDSFANITGEFTDQQPKDTKRLKSTSVNDVQEPPRPRVRLLSDIQIVDAKDDTEPSRIDEPYDDTGTTIVPETPTTFDGCNDKSGICFICDKGDQVLICSTNGCPLQIHPCCMGFPPSIGDTGNFYCPPCSYVQAIYELREVEKEVKLAGDKLHYAKKELIACFQKKELNASRLTPTRNLSSTNQDNRQERGSKSKYSIGVAVNPQQATSSTKCTDGYLGKEKSPVSKRNDISLTRERDNTKQVDSHQHNSMEDQLDEVTCANGDVGVETFLISETNDASVTTGQLAKQVNGRNDIGRAEEHQHTRESERGEMNAEANIGFETSGKDQNTVLKPKIEKNITSSSSKSYNSPTKCSSKPAVPVSRCNPVPWTSEEEEMLKDGVKRFSNKINKNIPWRKILEMGSHVFNDSRIPHHLREKWRRMNRKDSEGK